MSRNIIDEGDFIVTRYAGAKGVGVCYQVNSTDPITGKLVYICLTRTEFLKMCITGLRDYVEEG